jgi:hypothetical protein
VLGSLTGLSGAGGMLPLVLLLAGLAMAGLALRRRRAA